MLTQQNVYKKRTIQTPSTITTSKLDTTDNSTCSLPPQSSIPKKMIPSSKSQMSSLSRPGSNNQTSNTAAHSTNIGVDENLFIESFENVPRIQIYTSREVEQHMNQINDSIGNPNQDWEKRVDSLKRIRSLAIICQNQYDDEFFQSLRLITLSMNQQIKDLRSQIVREACITVAYLSQILKNKFEIFAESILNNLLNLIQNSAKVVSTSGIVAVRFIIENTHSGRFIPIIMTALTSKSKEIRRYSYELINQLLMCWETHHLEKHLQSLQTAIRKGIGDADQEARLFSRRAFWSFHAHFPRQAQILLDSFDAKTQKLLQSGSNGPTFGSIKSLNDNSNNYQSLPHDTVDRAKNTQETAKGASSNNNNGETKSTLSNMETNIDNAKTRIPLKDSAGVLPRNPLVANSRIPTFAATPKLSGTASRIAQSQPGSRSTSPTPMSNYITHKNDILQSANTNTITTTTTNNNNSQNNGLNSFMYNTINSTPKSKLTLNSSRNSSRESSPGRRSNFGSDRKPSLVKTPIKYTRTGIRRYDNGDSDEASETSSMCSERSYSSSIGGVRITEVRDFNELLGLLASSQWSERRDGIQALTLMMQNRQFTRNEIRYLIDTFTRMFQDPHGKVFSMFLDVLFEFIRIYKRDLQDWLYTLLTRILTKIGSESLTSVHQKLCKCLECVRLSFDLDLQFNLLIKFINDKTQTPSLKVKVAILKYLQDIICYMDAVDFHTTDELKCAVSKIISLTAEPKSADIRKHAQAVLIALFNLNTPEFSMLISTLPIKLQQPATQILNNHIKNFSQDTSSLGINYGGTKSSATSSPSFKPINLLHDHDTQLSHVIKDIQSLNVNKFDSRAQEMSLLMNERFTTSRLDSLSKDSGIQSNGGDLEQDEFMKSTNGNYKNTNGRLKTIDLILDTFNYTTSNDQIVQLLNELSQTIQFGSKIDSKWNEHFNNVLIRLFDYLNHNETGIQLSALGCLRDLLQFHSKEFFNFIELTICKLVDNYKDTQTEVSKMVEEVIYTAANCLPAEQCIFVLKPIIETPEYPKNLIAIRMLEKLLQTNMSIDLCRKYLGDILSPLLVAWDSAHSPVRKAAVFCLVALYMIVGEELRIHLNTLSSSKLKLLNVYINRAKEQSGKPV